MASNVSGSEADEVDVDVWLKAYWQRVRDAKRVVIKIGSNLLTANGETIQEDWIASRCSEIAALIAEGRQIVVVTSGAIAAGTPRLKLGRRPRTVPEKQAAAAAGQGVLMRAYEEAFGKFDLPVAQVLLTRDDASNARRYYNARDTLTTLLDLGLVPVINENDTVVTEEIRNFGDNDTLAALVACLVDADLLLLLSDVDGLFERDPRQDPEAKPIPLVERVTAEIEQLAGGIGSAVGKGGMATKLRAAKKSARCGCPMVLANGFREGMISRIMTGDQSGTLFLSHDDPINSRRRWIVNGLPCEGTLQLDDGAVEALQSGKSLLASGIITCDGDFDRGAAIYCVGRDGKRVAKGITAYASEHLSVIVGRKSSDFEALLGFVGKDEIIHRNDLVML
ncbi:MAG: glutamate 5-kinase [Magnetococcales bacterium]|nr:glutamate 5-kinase [Magnetococcales bacterium]